MEIKSVGMN